jgi:hypothetical protein
LVTVSADGPEHDTVRYLTAPFDGIDMADDFALHSVMLDWPRFWTSGGPPT